MRHQTLIQTTTTINKILVLMTNQAYANNHKLTYKVIWLKGDQVIADVDNKATKNYYKFRFYLIDKTNSPTGKEVDLLINYYPIKQGIQSLEHLEEAAYNEFLFNGVISLANISYALHLKSLEKEAVKAEDIKIDEKIEQLKKSVETPKLYVP
jgi:hypothetical protein